MAKRLLVTGGAGFIGSHVSEMFLERGWSVDVVDDLSTGRREQVPSGATLHEMDVRSAEAHALIGNAAFDALIHLAAQIDVRKSVTDPGFDASVNIGGTLNVLEAVRASRRSGEVRVVFASTGGALYGDSAVPPNAESIAKEPDSPYAIAKLGVEHYLAYYAKIHGLDTVALRFGNVYGPRQDPHGEAGVVAIFCGRILERRPLTVFGDGEQTRDYVYVRDVAEATFLAATRALPARRGIDSRAFNVGTGIGTSVNELANVLRSIASAATPIQYAPRRAGELQHSFLDVSRAADVLEWRAATALDRGLRETFQWFESRNLTKTGRA